MDVNKQYLLHPLLHALLHVKQTDLPLTRVRRTHSSDLTGKVSYFVKLSMLSTLSVALSLLFTLSMVSVHASAQIPHHHTDAVQSPTSLSVTPLPSLHKTDKQSATAAAKSKTHDSKRHQYQLDNGLQVIIKEDHRAPMVMTQIWYNVGATDEPAGKGGISHLLEHMMFKGTTKVPDNDFDRLIAKFGGETNAFTGLDYTAYYEILPANRLALALELEADRMSNLNFDDPNFAQEYVQERKVVMEERLQTIDDIPMARAYQQFRSMALPDSPKQRSIIGPMQDIEGIRIDELKSWYESWYAPNNATLVIVGDVNPDDAITQVRRYFDRLQPKVLPARPSLQQQGWRGFSERVLYETTSTPTLIMAFNVPTLPVAKAEDSQALEQEVYGLLMAQFVLDGGYAAHFETKLVREQGLLASVVSYYDLYERGDGLFIIQATPHDGVSLQQAQDAILEEVNQFKRTDISQAEIERARSNIVKDFVFSQDSLSGQAYLIGSLQSRGLDDGVVSQLPSELACVDAEIIKQAAHKYLIEDNLSVMHVVPYFDAWADPSIEESK